MAFIAMYSPRPGAVSSRWNDDVPQSVKRERLHMLNAEVEKYSLEYNTKLIGKTLRILITGCDDKNKYLFGLTEGKINVRINSSDDSMIGKFMDAQITGASEFSISGEPAMVFA
jgi:tRNA-2-methylthio-N6-dimethylallyladenosine synthase